jgi:XTP/dITP diphosphohydrolase
MKKLVVATGNPGKLKEMQAYLAALDWELTLKPEELDIEETGDTFAANACLKASYVAKATQNWAIADDSGLQIEALNGAPGVYSARYAPTDEERIARVLRELGNTQNREAAFVCSLAVSSPDGQIVYQSEGICPGEIIYQPRGQGGFGYDPIFYVPQKQLTFAEMSATEKKSISHRGKALASLLQMMNQ